jgi:hypothetical protein
MPRPERPIDPGSGPLAEFALGLRELRQRAGKITYRQLHRSSGRTASALSEAASGNRLPTLQITMAYVRACGGNLQEWERRWQETKTAVTTRAAPARQQKLTTERRKYLARASLMTTAPDGSAAPAADSAPPRRPDPRVIHTIPHLISELNRLRIWHGNPSLRDLARDSEHAFGPSTLGEALNRQDRLPSFSLLTAFVTTCGEPSELVEQWQNAWRQIALANTKQPSHAR